MNDATISLSLPYGDLPRHRLDVVVPTQPKGALVVCLPGGWGDRSRADLRPLLLALAEAGWPAAGAELIRPQDVRDPGMPVADVRTAASKAAEEAAILGADPAGVVLLSAGANALVAWAAAQSWGARPGLPRLRGLITLGLPPVVDAAQLTGAAIGAMRFLGHLGDPLTSDVHSLPPSLFLHGEQDPEIPHKLAVRLHQQLTNAAGPFSCAMLPGSPTWLETPHHRPGLEALHHILEHLSQHAASRLPIPLFAGRLPETP